LYWLSDHDGLFVLAYNKSIAEAAGISPAAVRTCLAEMVERADIEIFDKADGISFRRIILCDHPKAKEQAEFIRQVYSVPFRKMKQENVDG